MKSVKNINDFKQITKEQFVKDFDIILNDVEENKNSYLISFEKNKEAILIPFNKQEAPFTVDEINLNSETVKKSGKYDKMIEENFDYEKFDSFDEFLSKIRQNKTK